MDHPIVIQAKPFTRHTTIGPLCEIGVAEDIKLTTSKKQNLGRQYLRNWGKGLPYLFVVTLTLEDSSK
jgi:hypothetical protein